MLGCWAATGDLHSREACQMSAEALFHCMRTTVSLLPHLFGICTHFLQQPLPRKQDKPSINYHLARLGRRFQ